jgi:hypothetical protein
VWQTSRPEELYEEYVSIDDRERALGGGELSGLRCLPLPSSSEAILTAGVLASGASATGISSENGIFLQGDFGGSISPDSTTFCGVTVLECGWVLRFASATETESTSGFVDEGACGH